MSVVMDDLASTSRFPVELSAREVASGFQFLEWAPALPDRALPAPALPARGVPWLVFHTLTEVACRDRVNRDLALARQCCGLTSWTAGVDLRLVFYHQPESLRRTTNRGGPSASPRPRSRSSAISDHEVQSSRDDTRL